MSHNIALLGLGDDSHSSFLRGAAKAPAIVRESLFSPASNSFSELGINVLAEHLLTDLGDLSFSGTTDPIIQIEDKITDVVNQGYKPISIGGDHAVSYPIVKALNKTHASFNILHFDAHPDLYDEFEGDRYSHACPFARIMELGCVNRLVQVGIRTLNDQQREQIERFGVECYDMLSLDQQPLSLKLSGPLYISIDMDCLDPAFAPGVSHREPGGMSSREVIAILHQLAKQDIELIGADVVEYNPDRDIDGVTSVVAAKLVKELIALAV